jgi:hypothetical protein
MEVKLIKHDELEEIVKYQGKDEFLSTYPNQLEAISDTLRAAYQDADISKIYANALIQAQIECGKCFNILHNRAIDLGCDNELLDLTREIERKQNIEIWEFPKHIESTLIKYSISESMFPASMWSLIQELSEKIQVFPEMVALPLLSVLSLCVQDKAVINTGHIESLCIYSATIARPSERKSSVLDFLRKAIYKHDEKKRTTDFNSLTEYRAKLEYQEARKKKAKAKAASEQEFIEIERELEELKRHPVYEVDHVLKDATIEAAIERSYLNHGTLGILSDEGGIFSIIAGAYQKNNVPPNMDFLLDSYDGSQYSKARSGGRYMFIPRSVLTIGLMIQPTIFERFMRNREFAGNGFMQRFLFAFPKYKTAEVEPRKYRTTPISKEVEEGYFNRIDRLLSLSTDGEKLPELKLSAEAARLHEDYHYIIEDKMIPGHTFGTDTLCGWIGKHEGRCARIAGIFHLYDNDVDTPVSGDTMMKAINLANWCENQAYQALNGTALEDPIVSMSKRIKDYMKRPSCKNKWLTRRDIYRSLNINLKSEEGERFEEALELLLESYHIKDNGKLPTERGYKLKLNPLTTYEGEQ